MSLKPHQAASADAPEGVEIRSDVFISTFEEGGSINSLPEHDYNDDVASSSNKKGKTSMVKVLMSTTVAAVVLAAVGVTAYQMGVNQSASKMSTSMMSTTMTKSGKATGSPAPAPSGKAGKKACLEYGFLNDVVAAGSSTPIGADGPTGAASCAAISQTTALCCTEATSCYFPAGSFVPFDVTNQGCIDYLECLEDPENGPAIVGDWWLQRDVNNGEMYFVEDAVCGNITSTADDSRTRFELWNDVHLDMSLGFFKEFSVGYNYLAVGSGSGGYLNMYLRVDETSTAYYDCRFNYLLDNVVATGTLVITPETEADSIGGSCGGTTTIEDYLAANPGAVMGVGNGELYTFVLNTGSTGQDNSGSEICWGDVSIKHVDEEGTIYENLFEFTTLV